MSQRDLFEGQQRKRKGQDRVAANNARWIREMRSFARLHSSTHGSVTADDIRNHCDDLSWWPTHPNAFGAVFRPSGWVRVNYTRSTHATNRARVIGVWRWGG